MPLTVSLPLMRAAPAVLDHVAGALDRGGLADDAVVEPLAARLELFADHHRAIDGRAFFVAGEQEGDRQAGVGLRGQKFFDGHDHGGQRGFHVAGAAAVQLAVAVAWA